MVITVNWPRLQVYDLQSRLVSIFRFTLRAESVDRSVDMHNIGLALRIQWKGTNF